jgi:hypothetical protein
MSSRSYLGEVCGLESKHALELLFGGEREFAAASRVESLY